MIHKVTLALFALSFIALSDEIPKPTDAPQPMTPAETASSFKLPAGFRMEAVVSEPQIASPSGVCWDEQGRMFVSELHGYNLAGQLDIEELNKSGKLDTQVRRVQADAKFKNAAKDGTYGVIKLIRDSHGDGHIDSVEVWASDLPPVYGIVPARHGIIAACAPDIVYIGDPDGPGKSRVREVLFSGFRTGELERGINAPLWGDDGWIYFGRGWGGGMISGAHLPAPVRIPDSDFRIRADGSAIEPVTGGTHTFGFALNECGDRFVVQTTQGAIYLAPLPWRYLLRNPDVGAPPLEIASGDHHVHPLAPTHPWRKKRADDPAYFKYYNSRYGAAESEAEGWFTSACGPFVYRDQALQGLRGQYFVCEPAGDLIHRATIQADGTIQRIHRLPEEEKTEFAASSDAWCHPIFLTHGPDGSIWVVDYYREIIEDYSAIPRHLQQQYGVYNGHDRGRVYRLTHANAPVPPSANMSGLNAQTLGRECGSPLYWRRQTAQRLITERQEKSAIAALREILAAPQSDPSALICALHTLDALNSLTPADLRPFVSHVGDALRVHTLQLSERWYNRAEGRELLSDVLAAAEHEQAPRVQLQIALSLGETRDPRAAAILDRYARQYSGLKWMEAAILSSLPPYGSELLSLFLKEPALKGRYLEVLAQTIAARRDDAEFAQALILAENANAEAQAGVLNGLAKGLKSISKKPSDPRIADALAACAGNSAPAVAAAATALREAITAQPVQQKVEASSTVAAGKESAPGNGEVEVNEETFKKFIAALSGPRDLKRGHEIFSQICSHCHAVGGEGHEVGPDLIGELSNPEESLLKHILSPNTRIRPGYEATMVKFTSGAAPVTGILKDDGATSVTLLCPDGVEQVILRKHISSMKRLSTSLMPTFAEAMTPTDAACLLAWLKSNLGPKK